VRCIYKLYVKIIHHTVLSAHIVLLVVPVHVLMCGLSVK